ncbi:AAA family ATPase, partial [Pseudomonas viridiflava]
MKVDKLYIRSRFKNLENVRVDFDEDNLMTVVVGRNGTGKSNVLEALVSIFRNLDLGESPLFSYQIRYKLGEGASTRWIEIDADPDRGTLTKQYIAQVSAHKPTGDILSNSVLNSPEKNVQKISLSKIKRDTKTGTTDYLPNYLFAYYSGPSDRLEKYFKKHRTDFYKKLLKNQVKLNGDIR